MKIRMLTRIAGPDFSGAPGDVLDLAEAIARVLVERGFAEEVDEGRKPSAPTGEIETTDMPPGERAVNQAGAVSKAMKGGSLPPPRRQPRPKRGR